MSFEHFVSETNSNFNINPKAIKSVWTKAIVVFEVETLNKDLCAFWG